MNSDTLSASSALIGVTASTAPTGEAASSLPTGEAASSAPTGETVKFCDQEYTFKEWQALSNKQKQDIVLIHSTIMSIKANASLEGKYYLTPEQRLYVEMIKIEGLPFEVPQPIYKFLEDFDLLKDPLVQELLKQKDYIDAITDNFRERGTIGCPAFLIGEKLEKCIKTILGIGTYHPATIKSFRDLLTYIRLGQWKEAFAIMAKEEINMIILDTFHLVLLPDHVDKLETLSGNPVVAKFIKEIEIENDIFHKTVVKPVMIPLIKKILQGLAGTESNQQNEIVIMNFRSNGSVTGLFPGGTFMFKNYQSSFEVDDDNVINTNHPSSQRKRNRGYFSVREMVKTANALIKASHAFVRFQTQMIQGMVQTAASPYGPSFLSIPSTPSSPSGSSSPSVLSLQASSNPVIDFARLRILMNKIGYNWIKEDAAFTYIPPGGKECSTNLREFTKLFPEENPDDVKLAVIECAIYRTQFNGYQIIAPRPRKVKDTNVVYIAPGSERMQITTFSKFVQLFPDVEESEIYTSMLKGVLYGEIFNGYQFMVLGKDEEKQIKDRASEKELASIKRMVIENEKEHMTIPEIEVYLDDPNYFDPGHELTAVLVRVIAKTMFNQKLHREGDPLPMTRENLDEMERLANERLANKRLAKTKTCRQAFLTPANRILVNAESKTNNISIQKEVNFEGINLPTIPGPYSQLKTAAEQASSVRLDAARLDNLKRKMSERLANTESKNTPIGSEESSQVTLSITNTTANTAINQATTSSSSSNKKRRVEQWTNAEDELLRKSFIENNAKNWDRIAEALPERSGNSCRQRWYNQLDPSINKSNWTEEEDKIIIREHGENGNKWAQIAKYLNGRTNAAIRGRYNTTLKRLIKESQMSGNPVDVKNIRHRNY